MVLDIPRNCLRLTHCQNAEVQDIAIEPRFHRTGKNLVFSGQSILRLRYNSRSLITSEVNLAVPPNVLHGQDHGGPSLRLLLGIGKRPLLPKRPQAHLLQLLLHPEPRKLRPQQPVRLLARLQPAVAQFLQVRHAHLAEVEVERHALLGLRVLKGDVGAVSVQGDAGVEFERDEEPVSLSLVMKAERDVGDHGIADGIAQRRAVLLSSRLNLVGLALVIRVRR